MIKNAKTINDTDMYREIRRKPGRLGAIGGFMPEDFDAMECVLS